MTNKTKRTITSALLGIPSFALLFIVAKGFLFGSGIPGAPLYDIYSITLIWAQAGLAYRAFETREEFDSPPWLAYFFSYQIRLLVASIFISTVVFLAITAAKAPAALAIGIAGPIAFLFGREPKLSDLLKILDKK